MRFIEYLKENDKITKQDLINLEMYADRLFQVLGIDVEFSNHFTERINDPRNKKQITFSELASIFRRTFKKWGRKISKLPVGAEKVIKDMLSDINMPFAIDWDDINSEFDLVIKTIMRKKNFKSRSEKMRIG